MSSSQQQLADSFHATIDEILSKYLAGVTPEKKSFFDKTVHNWNVVAKVLPLIMAVISTSLVFITKEALTSLSSLLDVVPPLYVGYAKKNLDSFNKLFDMKINLEVLKGRISRAVSLGILQGDLVTEIENELRKYIAFFTSS